jgi:hypothetical protein
MPNMPNARSEDFRNSTGFECANWDVVFDDRGHFREPHTGLVFGLGTLAVREYLSKIGAPKLEPGRFMLPRIVTRGPHGCFQGAMFVEK